MKKGNKLVVFLGSALLVALAIVGITNAASNSSGHGMNDSAAPASAKDRNAFVTLWKKSLVEAKLNTEQKEKLLNELRTVSQKLSDNYRSLTDYREDQKKVKGDEAAKLKKRVDLKEEERDVIISQSKIVLGEFLNKDQLNMVLMAAFHNVSIGMTGKNHSADMKDDSMMSKSKLDQMAMDLGKYAEKINRNCEAVTLKLILENLK